MQTAGSHETSRDKGKRNERALQAKAGQTPVASRLRSTLQGKDERQDDQDHNHGEQAHQLDVLPPHPPLQIPSPHAELPRAAPQPIRLINQQIQPLPPLQQALNIPRHNPPDIVNLPLRRRDSIVLAPRRSPVVHHQPAQLRVEARSPVVGHFGELAGGGERLEEAPANLEEEAKGDAAAERGLGHDEEGEAAGGGVLGVLGRRLGDIVDVVVAVRVGELLWGVVADLGENERGEGRGLRGGRRGALGEDGGVVRDARAVEG